MAACLYIDRNQEEYRQVPEPWSSPIKDARNHSDVLTSFQYSIPDDVWDAQLVFLHGPDMLRGRLQDLRAAGCS